MGKTLAIALPFLIAILLLLLVMMYKVGKAAGEEKAIHQGTAKGDKVLRDADMIFRDLLVIDNVENDDLITDKTKERIRNWRNSYLKVF
jgi:hypothetical protein